MQPYETYRIGHVERDAVIERLAAAYAEGRIDAGEFDQRATIALSARTQPELLPLLSDIPNGYRRTAPPCAHPACLFPPRRARVGDAGALLRWFFWFFGPAFLSRGAAARASSAKGRRGAELPALRPAHDHPSGIVTAAWAFLLPLSAGRVFVLIGGISSLWGHRSATAHAAPDR